jgi:hypothetical protein
MHRLAGVLLTVGGVTSFLAGGLHPHGQPGQDFHAAIVSMLQDPMWPVAHWLALVSGVVVAWALSLLVDEQGTLAAVAGVRFGVVASLFMAVEFAVELAARTDVTRFATGEATPIISLVDAMQAVGWPAFALAFVLLASGTRWAPRWVGIIGVIGAVAFGVGGLGVMGLQVVALAPVFVVGGIALPIWMVWAGIQLARRTDGRVSSA